MSNKLVWGGQVKIGLMLMKKSHVEDVSLADLLVEIAGREPERAEIQPHIEGASEESLEIVFRVSELGGEIDSLRVLEETVRETLATEAS